VAQLPEPVKAETEIVVAESVADGKLLLGGHTDFELVLSPGISYDFPVVLPVHERPI